MARQSNKFLQAFLMQKSGRIIVRGIVQGVGFRPFVYAQAKKFAISGKVKNLGSEVEILASGSRFDEFLDVVREGPPMARIDSVRVYPLDEIVQPGFFILPSGEGSLSGMIPPDIAICDECLEDIDQNGSRYKGYWGTSCVNCGPRYSIIQSLPYDRERTSMKEFLMCTECASEYSDPDCRRHHAQTIACQTCGPGLSLLDSRGNHVECGDIIAETAELLDGGAIVAIRGIGGFHIACVEESAGKLKRRLGRTEQPLAVMVRPDYVDTITRVSAAERLLLEGYSRPIVVLEKKDYSAHSSISNLHTIGCMLPYTGLHHLLFRHLGHPLLIMTSANVPGYPMITDLDQVMSAMSGKVEFFLTHDRQIVNRCDDSVIRDGYIIRLSRGIAPKRTRIDLGKDCMLGVGPELNSNITIYKDGFCITSPHIGNVRNPRTYEYLQETIDRFGTLLGAGYDRIAHDAHPQFLSTRYAKELADSYGSELVPVQHHKAHIAATTTRPCVGIAIDGVGYGEDGTIWGGEIFAGQAPLYRRVAHLETVPMPGGDLATRFPERMLYGMLPVEEVADILSSRGWSDIEIGVLEKQLRQGINVARTSSTGRVLDAASSLLGICRERTYDGEPAMKLESWAAGGTPESWDLVYERDGDCEILSTRSLLKNALFQLTRTDMEDIRQIRNIAASFQFNLARGIAGLAIHAAGEMDIPTVALSGGVAYNFAIRETITQDITAANLDLVINAEYPLGDGCISYGQCICAGLEK
jgi:hydrogenase maturation protein HypF